MAARNGRGGARPGAGRKPKATKERQRNRVMVSFTDAEYQALERAAGPDPIGTYIRSTVLLSVARRRK